MNVSLGFESSTLTLVRTDFEWQIGNPAPEGYGVFQEMFPALPNRELAAALLDRSATLADIDAWQGMAKEQGARWPNLVFLTEVRLAVRITARWWATLLRMERERAGIFLEFRNDASQEPRNVAKRLLRAFLDRSRFGEVRVNVYALPSQQPSEGWVHVPIEQVFPLLDGRVGMVPIDPGISHSW